MHIRFGQFVAGMCNGRRSRVSTCGSLDGLVPSRWMLPKARPVKQGELENVRLTDGDVK
jgi:hypothetical protein